jgi:hypothetical protein
MAEMKFPCPACGQLIACDELWIGQEIQCPICAASLSVPNQQAAAAPASPLVPKAPGGAPRLSISQTKHQSTAPPPGAARTTNPLAARGQVKKPTKQKSGLAKTLAVWGIVLAAVGAGVYFGWPYLKQYQEKFNSKSREEAKNSDGGEAGHIANLNNMLDATDPARPGGPRFTTDADRAPRSGGGGSRLPAGNPAGQVAGAAATNLPVIPTQYSLDTTKAKIPDGKVNGMISGSNFVTDIARLDPGAGTYILRLLQGPLTAPERGLIVYLRLKAGEKIEGHTWDIGPDEKGGPQVSKLWKANPKYAARTQNYSTGYALKVELGEVKDGQISGKLYVALPDTEQSYAGGIFMAQTTLGAAGTMPAAGLAAPPPGVPTASGMSPSDKATFDKRYGIKK